MVASDAWMDISYRAINFLRTISAVLSEEHQKLSTTHRVNDKREDTIKRREGAELPARVVGNSR